MPIIKEVFLWQGPSSAEWIKLKVAAASLGKSGADLQDQLSKCSSCLVMEFIPGLPLFEASEPFQTDRINQTASDLGRWATLDRHLEPKLGWNNVVHFEAEWGYCSCNNNQYPIYVASFSFSLKTQCLSFSLCRLDCSNEASSVFRVYSYLSYVTNIRVDKLHDLNWLATEALQTLFCKIVDWFDLYADYSSWICFWGIQTGSHAKHWTGGEIERISDIAIMAIITRGEW